MERDKALEMLGAVVSAVRRLPGGMAEVDLGKSESAYDLLLAAGGLPSQSDQSSCGVWWRKRWVTFDFDGVQFCAWAQDVRLKMVEVD